MRNRPTETAQNLRQHAEERFRAGESSLPELTTPEESRRLFHELQVHQIELEMQNDELLRAHEELNASQARYFDLYDLAPVGYLTTDESGRIKEANLTAAAMLGVDRSVLIKLTINRIIFKDDRNMYHLHQKESRDSSTPDIFEIRLVRGDDTQFWAHLQLIAAQKGESWLTFTDITERKLAETNLEAANKMLQTVIDTVPVRIFWKDAELRFLGCNHAFAADLGAACPEDLIGKDDFQLMRKEQAELFRADDRRVMESGTPLLTYDQPQILEDGDEIIWLRASKVPLRNAAYAIMGVLGVYEDITWRKRIENELHKKQQRLTTLLHETKTGTWEWNVQTGETVFNEQWADIIGYTLDEIAPVSIKTWMKNCHPDDLQISGELLEKHFRGESAYYEYEARMKHKDGHWIWVMDRGRVVSWSDDGTPLWMFGTHHDVTERIHLKNLQKRSDISLKGAMAEILRLQNRLQAENVYLHQELDKQFNFGEIIGESNAIRYVFDKVVLVAPLDATVLLLGETGTGKGVIARAIHGHSAREKRQLISVDCATLPANLIESELFGRERGAFTGADARQVGRFELANGGTIFLDEIGEIPLELQSKLLRIIQDGEFERLGSPHTIKVDVRIIAASNRNLQEEIRAGRFREDLFYRLNVFPIIIPPLRERVEDIPLLVNHFIAKFNKKYSKKIEALSIETLNALQQYLWPGNVRELESVIERAVIISRGSSLQVLDRFDIFHTVEKPAEADIKALTLLEQDHILQALQKTGWRISGAKGAALLLGINASTLRSRIKKYGIIRR
jgi:PAS domain S-box-containing protein